MKEERAIYYNKTDCHLYKAVGFDIILFLIKDVVMRLC